MIKGKPKFNIMKVEYVSVAFGSEETAIRGEAALRSDIDDALHGGINVRDDTMWSTGTLEKARELKRAMEGDLAKRYFESDAEHVEPETETARGSGVGEFFREPEDAAQV